MNNSSNNYQQLIERYVYAVVRQLPGRQRKDIEQELTSLINDMIEERCGEITPTERDVNVVLAELGKPSELAAKYDPDGERSLIGPRYYRRYIQTMKIVLPSAALGLLAAALISLLVEGMGEVTVPAVMTWIFTWLGNIITTVISAAAIVTFIFAVFEYKGVSLDEDDISRLPAVPKDSQLISKGECVAGIVFTAVCMMLFLFVPQFVCFFGINETGVTTYVPMFSADVMRSVWYCWVAVFGLGIVREVLGLAEGVYTRRYAIVSAVINVLSAIGIVFALTRPGIIAPECISHVQTVFADEPGFLVNIFQHFNVFLIAVWVFALLMDTVTAFVKYIRYSRS